MVTRYSHAIASTDPVIARPVAAPLDERIGTRILDWVRQVVCSLRGHDSLLQFEQERMFLRCVSCGHESPGWDLNEAPPTVSVRGDARRHSLVGPQLVDARRIA